MLILENKRLACCAKMLADGEGEKNIVADIGTDHGYLACYLVQSGICKGAVAADINPLPLSSAEKTVERLGLSDRVKTVLSDGLDNVPPEGVTDIVCAGMGGTLIGEIILRANVRRARLILQPMTKADELRRVLYDNGYFVERENAVRDGNFVYTVMRVLYAPKCIDYPCDERYLSVGRIIPGDEEADDYIRRTALKKKKAAEGIFKSRDEKMKSVGEAYLQTASKLLDEIGEKL